VARDPRPVLLALAEHDEVRAPAEVQAEVAGWTAAQVEVLPGASHFFGGGTERLVELADALVTELGA
jgi:alpha/beta superfamily hydrolase